LPPRTLTKKTLVAKVAMDAGLSKVHAEATVDSLLDGLARALKKNGSVTLAGFGTFKTEKRKTGRNAVNFKPGKALQDAID
jgi:DNA-binding protein HU-beta